MRYSIPVQVTLTIPDEVAAQARDRGVPLDEYVLGLIEQAVPHSVKRKRTLEEFHAWLEEFTQYSEKMPVLPNEALSREAIYDDRGV
jgi:post-segregation antitoxin (ccd killing protein)